jgi:microcin C transport system substrate-binding protein
MTCPRIHPGVQTACAVARPPRPARRGRTVLPLLALAGALHSVSAFAAHAYAQFGDIKYPPGFAHFEWANPKAPKGGHLDLVPPLRITNFDKYNPFTLKGTAPPGLSALVFETLLTGTFDEPTTSYGLLAEDVQVAPDRRSATFRLNPAARFHNGKPLTAEDVKHSFDTLMSKQAAPQYRVIFSEVSRAVVVASDTVRFEFKNASAELPLLVGGGIPVFSREWGAGKPFDEVVMEPPIATGPYRIGRVNFGRDITYNRDPEYWARNLNVRASRRENSTTSRSSPRGIGRESIRARSSSRASSLRRRSAPAMQAIFRATSSIRAAASSRTPACGRRSRSHSISNG